VQVSDVIRLGFVSCSVQWCPQVSNDIENSENGFGQTADQENINLARFKIIRTINISMQSKPKGGITELGRLEQRMADSLMGHGDDAVKNERRDSMN
jgi:hypothetical protein